MIYKANSEILENMDKNVDVHNISEERNVGSFNYASIVRDGGKFLKFASQDVVIYRLVRNYFSRRIQKILKLLSIYSGNQDQKQ